MNEASDLKQPLLSREDNVSDWLHSYIRQENSQAGWSSRDCTRAVSKCALAAIVTLRNVAFMPVSLKLPLAGWNWASAVGNVIGVSALDFWVGNLFINDSLPQSTGLEKVSPQKTSTSSTAATIGNLTISLLSQIPSVYPTMQYNPGPLSVPAGLVVLFGGAVLPLRSIQLSMEKYYKSSLTEKQGLDCLASIIFSGRRQLSLPVYSLLRRAGIPS